MCVRGDENIPPNPSENIMAPPALHSSVNFGHTNKRITHNCEGEYAWNSCPRTGFLKHSLPDRLMLYFWYMLKYLLFVACLITISCHFSTREFDQGHRRFLLLWSRCHSGHYNSWVMKLFLPSCSLCMPCIRIRRRKCCFCTTECMRTREPSCVVPTACQTEAMPPAPFHGELLKCHHA